MAQETLQKTVVPLRGGLDLISPRFSVAPGTLQDCLNYETFPITGYSVIDGFCRYDGLYPCYAKDWVVARRMSGTGTFLPGQYLKNGSNYFGVTLFWDATNQLLHYLIFDQKYAPKGGDLINTAPFTQTLQTAPGGIKRASLFYKDEAEFLSMQFQIYQTAREQKAPVYPYISYAKNVIPHGLHWYKSRLYAIVDNYQIAFNSGTVEPLPGDILGNLTRTNYGVVLSVNVTQGSWVSGNAQGTIVVRPMGIATTNTMPLGGLYVHRPNGASVLVPTLSVNVTELQIPNSPTAGLYCGPYDDDRLSSSQALANINGSGKLWQPVDMGWEIEFATDVDTTGDAPATTFRGEFVSDVVTNVQSLTASATTEVLDPIATLATPLGPNSRTQPNSTPLHTVLSDGFNTTFVALGSLSAGQGLTSAWAKMQGFTGLSTINSAAIITGFELVVVANSSVGTPLNANFKLDGTLLNQSVTAPAVKELRDVPTGITTFTLGSPTDLWGAGTLTTENLLAAVRDPTFGVKFNLTTEVGDQSAVYELSLKVYYRQAVSTYYAHDTVTGQDLQIEIPYYRLLKGQFNPGSDQNLAGSGTMSLYNIKALSSTGVGSVSSTTWTIGSGWELRTARNGGGVLVAKFTSQMKAASLPSRSTMEAAKKRFEIVTANYYANADWKAFYGVSGCGPSFQFDGYYFYNVYTALPVTEDTPSHIAYHRNYNILGFENGQCIVSVPNQPTNFSPTAGSTLYPFGDRVTGLLSLNGTALCVLCESSIHALTGDVLAATPANNAVSQVISPYSGAIEYTVVDCGIPLFADFRGISTIDATDKYGDFENGRISYQVTPVLSNRVNDRFTYQSTNQSILFALPVRSKNQYRLYFADGLILTCSLPTGDRGYEFTKQQYMNGPLLDTLVPVAACTGTSSSGRDLLFATFKIVPFDDTNRSTPSSPQREGYVYSLDKGTQFDNASIRHFVRLNFQSLGEMNDYDIVRKVRIDLLSSHYFDGYLSLSTEYESAGPARGQLKDDAAGKVAQVTPAAAKRLLKIDPKGKSVRIDKDADYLVASTEGIGTTVAIEIGGEHKYPGHVLQALLVYSIPAREQLGNSPTQKLT